VGDQTIVGTLPRVLVPMDVVSTETEGEAGGVSVSDPTHDVRGRPVVLAAGGPEGDDAEPRIRLLGGVGLWAAGAVVASGVVAAASFWTVIDSVGTSHDPLWVSPVTVSREANDDRPSESPSDDASHDADDDSGRRSNDDASDLSGPVTTDDSGHNSGPGSGDEPSDNSSPDPTNDPTDNSGPGSSDEPTDNSGPGSGGGSGDNSGPGGGSGDNSGVNSGHGSDSNSGGSSGSNSGHGSS
jgi:uncharacterized membrane protein YgcG